MDLTVVIAHYRRRGNVDRIAANLPRSARLFVVDNAAGGPRLGRAARARADWVLDSSRNNLATRWFLAAQADTPFYCIHDDDLMLAPDVYRQYTDALARHEDPAVRVLTGPVGIVLAAGSTYEHSPRTTRTGDRADIILGRLAFGEVRRLAEVPACPRGIDGHGFESVISEDIFASATLAARFGVRLRVTNLGGVVELPAPHASSDSPAHYDRRDLACRLLFRHFNDAAPGPTASAPG